VVLLMLIQSFGHVALRLLGSAMGLAAAGLAAGFVSSSATVAAMGVRSKQNPSLLMPCVSGALWSTAATSIQLAMIALVVDASLLRVLAAPLGCALLASLAVGVVALARSPAVQEEPLPDQEAFKLWQSVGVALALTAATALVAWVQPKFGVTATYTVAILTGIVDAHASAAALMSLASQNEQHIQTMRMAVALSLTSNTVAKAALALTSGGLRFGLPTAAGLLAVLTAMWLPILAGF
jgi:uncharacterized membrane protein (DUF4010 family)